MYVAYFGFRSLPFNGSPALDDLYRGAAFVNAYDALREGVDRNDGLMLLTGAQGVGKTTLLRKLQASLESQGFTVFVPDASCRTEELIEVYRAYVELMTKAPIEPASAQVGHERSPAASGSGGRVVVIVDDADSLPDQILQSVQELLAPGRRGAARVTVILAGLPRLTVRLKKPDFAALGCDMACRHSLIPLDEEEIRAYVHKKLEVVGYEGPELFDDDSVHALAQHACGIPQRIDTLCGMALLIACETHSRTVDGGTIAEAVGDLEGLVEDTAPPAAREGRSPHVEDSDGGAGDSNGVAVATQEAAYRLLHRASTAIRHRLTALVAVAGLEGQTIRRAWWRVMHRPNRVRRRRCGMAIRQGGGSDDSRLLRPVPEKDWLAVKIGFVGLTSLGVLVLLIAVFLVQPESNSPVAVSKPTRAQLPGGSRARTTASLEEALEALGEKRELIRQHRANIKQLNEQLAASAAQLAIARQRTQPVNVTFSKDAVFRLTTPSGETFVVGPRELSENKIEHLGLPGLVTVDQLEVLKRLAAGENAGQADRAAAMGSKAAGVDDAPAFTLVGGPSGETGQDTGSTAVGGDGMDDTNSNDLSSTMPTENRLTADATTQKASDSAPLGEQVVAMTPSHRSAPNPSATTLTTAEDGSVAPSESGARAGVASESRSQVPGEIVGIEEGLPSAMQPVADTPVVRNVAAARQGAIPPSATLRSTEPLGVTRPSGNFYEVAAGDSLSAISRRFRVEVADLRKWNELTGDWLAIGQSLRVSAQNTIPSSVSAQLPAAAAEGQLPRIEELLDAGAFIDTPDDEGKTALMHAAARGHYGIVIMLVNRGADVNLHSKAGGTALSFAAWNGNLFILSRLLRHGADVNAKNSEGWTALMYASINGHVQCVRRLLDEGADVNARDNGSRTALSAAVWNGHTQTAEALLEEGADVNERTGDGWTALMNAAWNGDAALVEVLLENGADPMAESDTGLTPIEAAEQQGHAEIATAISRSFEGSS